MPHSVGLPAAKPDNLLRSIAPLPAGTSLSICWCCSPASWSVSADQSAPTPLMVRDVLYCATMGGARCTGLDDKIGSLTSGKEADIIIIRADDINLHPSNNALGAVVQAADRGNVDTLIIDGRVRKYRGKVVGANIKRLKAMVEESRGHLFSAIGYRSSGIFADRLPKLP